MPAPWISNCMCGGLLVLRIRWDVIVLLILVDLMTITAWLHFLFIAYQYIFSSHMWGITITWCLSLSSVNCCKLCLMCKEHGIPHTCDTHLLMMSRPLYELCIWFVPRKRTPFRGWWGCHNLYTSGFRIWNRKYETLH